MVEFSVVGNSLLIQVHGFDKVWAFTGSLEIPLMHITTIRADPTIARGWWHGFRVPGTNVPGVLTAGTFYQHGKRVFWDVHNPENTVVLELRDERYNELIVEVVDPHAIVEMVNAAIPQGEERGRPS